MLSSAPKFHTNTDDENVRSKQNARYNQVQVKSHRTHMSDSNMQIYEDGVGPRGPLSISTIGGNLNETPSLMAP